MNTTQRITDLYKQSLGDSPEAPKTPLKRTWTASMGIRYQQTDATFLPNQQAVDQEKVIQRDPCLYSNIIGVFQIYAMEHHHHHPSSIVSSRTITREMIGETIRVRLPGGSDKLDKKSSNNNLGEEVLINVHMSSDAAMIDSVSVTTFAEEPMASVEQVADAKMNSILSQQQEIESALASSKVATEQMLEDCVPLSSSSSSSSSSSLSLSPATAAAGDPTIQDIGAQVLEQRILERKLQEISGDITRIQVDRFAFKCVYFITAGEFKLININDRLYQFHLLRYEYAPQEIVLYKRSYLLQRAVYCTDIKCRLHLRCGVPTKNLHYQRPPAASMMDHLSAFQCSYKNIKRTEREQEQESGSKRRRRCRSDPSSSDIDIVDLEESDTRDSWIDEDTNSFM